MFDPQAARRLLSPWLLCAAALLVVPACDDDGAPANTFDSVEDASDTPEPDAEDTADPGDTAEPDSTADTNDATDTADAVDTTDATDTTDTTDTADATDATDTTDTADTGDVSNPLPTEMPVAYQAIATDNEMISALAVDFTGDGQLDLAGLDSTGKLVLVATGRDANGDPTFGTPGYVTLAAGDTPRLLAAGEFNGDDSIDLAAWDPATGGVSVATNTGTSFDNPIIAFDNPIIAFDNPIIAFDNPIIAFDNPIIANESSWAVGDFDGSGTADIAFFNGTKGASVAWSDTTGGGFNVAQPAGLSDFDNPIIAAPVAGTAMDATGDGNTDLVVGFAVSGNAQFDGLGFFEHDGSQGFDNPIIAFDNPIIASPNGGEMQGVAKGISTVKSGELNGDSSADVAWLSASSGGATAGGVWLSSFDNPIIATDPENVSFSGDGAQLEFGRLLLDQSIGTGAAGALDLLDAYAHIIVLPPAGSMGDAIAIPVLNDMGGIGRILELGNAGALGKPFDIDGDGFSEFLQLDATGMQVGRQENLDNLTQITLSDGSTIDICELSTAYCAGGSRGVCNYAREVCGVCSPTDEFAVDFPGVMYSDIYEPTGETTCDDGLDNDCDGLIDELTDAGPVSYTGLPATVERFEAFRFGWGDVVFWSTTPGGQLSYAVYPTPGMPATRTGSTATTDDTTIFATSYAGVAFYGDTAGSQIGGVIDSVGESLIETSGFSVAAQVELDVTDFDAMAFALEGGTALSGSGTSGQSFSRSLAAPGVLVGGEYEFDGGAAYVLDPGSNSIEVYGFDVFQGLELTGSPLTAFTGSANIVDGHVANTSGIHCLVLETEDAGASELLLVELAVIVDGMLDFFDVAQNATVSLSDRPIVPGSVEVVADLGHCYVTWLEPGSMSSGTLRLREALYQPGAGLIREQRLAAPAVRGPSRITTSFDATTNVIWLPEGATDARIQTMCVPSGGL